MRDDAALAAGFAAAGFGVLGTTVVLTPLRGHSIGPTCAVTALVLVVATSAALAGAAAGTMATLTAVLSFDFFFVPPYLELKVGRAADRWPIIALVVVGTGIVIAARRRAGSAPAVVATDGPNPSGHVERVTRLIEQRADPRDLVLAVEAELTVLLSARRCRFEPGERSAERPQLERSGAVVGRGIEPALPPIEVEVPVQEGTRRLGAFVIEPTPDAIVPMVHRVTALVLADHLGRALAARKSSTPPLA